MEAPSARTPLRVEIPTPRTTDQVHPSRCSLAGPHSVARSSIGPHSVARSSIGRHSVEQFLLSPQRRSLTLNVLVLDYLNELITKFDALTLDESKDERKAMLDDLHHLLSTKTEQERNDMLANIQQSFAEEAHFNDIIISVTRCVMAERELCLAYDVHGFNRYDYWRQVINESVAQCRENQQSLANSEAVQLIIMQVIESLIQELTQDKNLGSLALFLQTYLHFKCAQEEMAEIIFGQLASSDSQSLKLSVVQQNNSFDSISADAYVAVNLENKIKQIQDFEKIQNLKEIFQQQLEKLKLIDFLREANLTEIEEFLNQGLDQGERLRDAFANDVLEVVSDQHQVYDILNKRTLTGGQQQKSQSATKKLLQSPLDLLHKDKNNNTALDLALKLAEKSKNSDIVKRVLERAQHDGSLKDLVGHSLSKMLDSDGTITDVPGMFYLIIQEKCLFNVALVASIRGEDEMVGEGRDSHLLDYCNTSFVSDTTEGYFPETVEHAILKFSKLFDEQNHFISQPKFIDYVIQNADIETFQLLMNNILSQQRSTACQNILYDYLQSAVKSGCYARIAKILTFAEKYKCAEVIMRKALFAMKDDGDQLEDLIAGAYLFKSDYGAFKLKYGGLFNPVFFQQVRSAYFQADETCGTPISAISMSTSTVQQNYNSQQTQQTFDNTCSALVDAKGKFSLSEQQLTSVNKKLLECADDEALAYFIQEAGSNAWPHNTENRAGDIRNELRRRYIDTSKPLPAAVKNALQKNWNVKQDADKLATFYDMATHHVVKQYPSNPSWYAKKATAMLGDVNKIASDESYYEKPIITKSEFLATALSKSKTIGERRPSVVPDLHRHSKTQRLVSAGQKKLNEKPSMWNSMQHRLTSTICLAMGWSHQRDKSVLERDNETLTDCLTIDQLNIIPITPQQKKECVQRAVLAHAAFKKTLEYLETRPNKDKFNKMDGYLQLYINGDLAAEKLIDRLEAESISKADDALGKRIGWGAMWQGPSATGRRLQKDLKASCALLRSS